MFPSVLTAKRSAPLQGGWTALATGPLSPSPPREAPSPLTDPPFAEALSLGLPSRTLEPSMRKPGPQLTLGPSGCPSALDPVLKLGRCPAVSGSRHPCVPMSVHSGPTCQRVPGSSRPPGAGVGGEPGHRESPELKGTGIQWDVRGAQDTGWAPAMRGMSETWDCLCVPTASGPCTPPPVPAPLHRLLEPLTHCPTGGVRVEGPWRGDSWVLVALTTFPFPEAGVQHSCPASSSSLWKAPPVSRYQLPPCQLHFYH